MQQKESLAKPFIFAKTEKRFSSGRGLYWFEFYNGLLVRVFQSPVIQYGEKIIQVVLPKSLHLQVLKLAHCGLLAGHLGVSKTFDRISSSFYWLGMHGDISRFCQSCDTCQKTIPIGKVKKVPLEQMPIIDIPFKRIAIDLVGPIYPSSDHGHKYILSIIDYATRYPEAIPLKHIDTETVAEALVNVFSKVGVPEEVVSDCGTQFTSDLMK